jgi:cyanophycinase-like exopeptidase
MYFRWILIGLLLCIGGFVQFDSIAAQSNNYQLMLIGSELPYCRSSSLHRCNTQQLGDFNLSTSRRAPLYNVSPTQIEQVMNPSLWHFSRQALRHDLNIVLRELSKTTSSKHLSKEQLLTRWKRINISSEQRQLSGYSLLTRLNSKEKNMIFDFFELPQFDSFSNRIKEAVNLSDKLYLKSVTLFKRVVEQARLVKTNPKPNILFVTAGDRDPFENVDSFNSIFSQSGAKATWLPIDSALATLLGDRASCRQLDSYRNSISNNYSRARIYPDLVKIQLQYCNEPSKIFEAIEQADAIVFTGQSPILLRKSLVDSTGKSTAVLKAIKSQMFANKLFVASIGGATLAMGGGKDRQNNTVAMMISGNSEMAFQSGTVTNRNCDDYLQCQDQDNRTVNYEQHGGIGLFSVGVVDTEISSNSNFGRLTKVAFDNHNKFGIGLDQLTAVLVRVDDEHTSLEVAGFGGATVIDHSFTQGLSNNMELKNVFISYLTPQDTAEVSGAGIKVFYPEWKKLPSNAEGEVVGFNNLFYSNNFNKFTQQACVTQDIKWSGFAGKKRQFQIDLSKDDHSVLRSGGVKVGNQYQLYCSFDKLQLNIVRRQ